ncbi:hypothetical protein EVAR_52104_1 [Eumeta japonica]|uniref:Uncharacterized protein n=1 Tax=Eumeta variegata TaxID=151549 RepID=A0A4C1XQ91_EUMVA|nr:hypothetical protein EVAR_52104_1 [Eumeta japonica]
MPTLLWSTWHARHVTLLRHPPGRSLLRPTSWPGRKNRWAPIGPKAPGLCPMCPYGRDGTGPESMFYS